MHFHHYHYLKNYVCWKILVHWQIMFWQFFYFPAMGWLFCIKLSVWSSLFLLIKRNSGASCWFFCNELFHFKAATCKHCVFGDWSSIQFAFYQLPLFEGRQRTEFERMAVDKYSVFRGFDGRFRERFSNGFFGDDFLRKRRWKSWHKIYETKF